MGMAESFERGYRRNGVQVPAPSVRRSKAVAPKVEAVETTEEKLARVRQMIKDADARDRKAAHIHRDPSGTGQFVQPRIAHSATTNATDLRHHLQHDHGIAQSVVAPLIGSSLHNLHTTSHAAGGAD